MQKDQIIIHTDGGSRGNPGPAACAFIVEQNEKLIFKSSKFLGVQTNNYAEYQAVILALQWLSLQKTITNHSLPIIFFLDSELVVKQINALYKVKDENLRNLFFEVLSLMKKLGNNIVFKHVSREKNKTADLLVNIELDRNI
jgi:ribonuclease HI